MPSLATRLAQRTHAWTAAHALRRDSMGGPSAQWASFAVIGVSER